MALSLFVWRACVLLFCVARVCRALLCGARVLPNPQDQRECWERIIASPGHVNCVGSAPEGCVLP